MLLLQDAVIDKKADVRILEKNLTRGTVTPKEADDLLKRLPDDSANAEWVSVEGFVRELGRPSFRV